MTVISTSHYDDQKTPNPGNGWPGGIAYDANLGLDPQFSIVAEPHGAVKNIARYRSTNGASQFGWGEGLESYVWKDSQASALITEGADEWYGFGLRTEADFVDPIHFLAIMQFYCFDYAWKGPGGITPFVGSPPALMSLGGNGLYISNNAGHCTPASGGGASWEVNRWVTIVPGTAFKWGVWTDVMMHIVWSKGPSGS